MLYFGTNTYYLDLFTQLMLAAIGSKHIDKALDKRKMKNEQKRLDSLFWQEAIRKKNDIADNCDDDW